MEYSVNEKYRLMKLELLKNKSNDPIQIIKSIMNHEFVSIHGPEHHFLDGASIMVAMKNAGLDFELEVSLDKLAERTIKMPGAMCGFWGICGSVASIGAVFAIIDGTGPLSNDKNYSTHMEFTSGTLSKMSEIGGPRCCKRNAFISIREGVKYANNHYNLDLPIKEIECGFSNFNAQCIKNRCPFYMKG